MGGKRYGEYCDDCRIQRYYDKRVVKALERPTRRDHEGILMYLCKTCGEYKYNIDFHRDRHNDVVRSVCAKCYNSKHKARGIKHGTR